MVKSLKDILNHYFWNMQFKGLKGADPVENVGCIMKIW